MNRIKFYFIVSICVALVACAGMQPTEETLKSVELNGHQISIGMASEKVRELASEPDSIVQGGNFDSSGAGQVAVYGGKPENFLGVTECPVFEAKGGEV
jgi:hypothetical protein